MAVETGNKETARRRHSLLMAVVQDFVTTAEPIGSRHIARNYSLGVKAATVRNLMAELEDQGYLHQPHTSAGRVPTDKAFRYYVDSLMPPRLVAFDDRAKIEFCYSEPARDVTAIMKETSRLLSLLTGHTAVVLAPRLESVSLERVHFVRLRPRQVLALFVASAGGVHNRLLENEYDYLQPELDRMAQYLNELLQGRTLESARKLIERALGEEYARYDSFARQALKLGGALVSFVSPAEIFVEGSAKAIEQPEFSDPDKLRELLRALEDKGALLQLLERSLSSASVLVSIGSENVDLRLNDLSFVAAAYLSGSTSVGSLAVLGPVRMDYGRVIPLVDYTAKALSRIFEPQA